MRTKAVHYFDFSLGRWPYAPCGAELDDAIPNFTLFYSGVGCTSCQAFIQRRLDDVAALSPTGSVI